MIGEGYKKSQIKQTVAKKYYGHLEVLPAEARGQPADAGRPRGRGHVPGLQHDARPVELTRGATESRRSSPRRIAAGDSKNEIKDVLVAEYGPSILAAPPKKGFNLLAWLLPFVALFGGALVLGFLAWRWSHTREPRPPAAQLSPALERRVDEELARYDEG